MVGAAFFICIPLYILAFFCSNTCVHTVNFGVCLHSTYVCTYLSLLRQKLGISAVIAGITQFLTTQESLHTWVIDCVHTVENADVHTGKTPTCIPVNTMDSSIETYLKIFDAIHMGGNIPPCPAARYLDLSRHKCRPSGRHFLLAAIEIPCGICDIPLSESRLSQQRGVLWGKPYKRINKRAEIRCVFSLSLLLSFPKVLWNDQNT